MNVPNENLLSGALRLEQLGPKEDSVPDNNYNVSQNSLVHKTETNFYNDEGKQKPTFGVNSNSLWSSMLNFIYIVEEVAPGGHDLDKPYKATVTHLAIAHHFNKAMEKHNELIDDNPKKKKEATLLEKLSKYFKWKLEKYRLDHIICGEGLTIVTSDILMEG